MPRRSARAHCLADNFPPLRSDRGEDLVRPFIADVGGGSQSRRTAAQTGSFRVDVSRHAAQIAMSTMASPAVCACPPNCTLSEEGSGQDPLFWNDLFFGGHFQLERGYASRPEPPGLGIDLDEKVAVKYPYGDQPVESLRFPDGSISDR